MASSEPFTFRIPLILLAIGNLALLGMRLWPWQDVFNLPLNGATGIDPGVALVGYIGLIYWMANTRNRATQSGLASGAVLGLLGGAILVAQVMLTAQPASDANPRSVLLGHALLVAAAVVWGTAGLLGARVSGDAILGLLSGAWSAMTSCLFACTAVLVEMSMAAPGPVTTDPWKQYEGLAIGNTATQSLVNSLNTGLTFLLVGPLVGAGLGLVFGFFGQTEKH
jgi:hypothetical protein